VIQRLNIKNYALIEQLEFIPAQKGMNIITGETGAGKSIIIGALGLILGERADSKVLRDKETKCVVEAHFEVSKFPMIIQFMEESDFDYSNPLIVRREISTSGRSRAFVNDTPASLVQLKDLGEMLVDVHSQHQNLKLNEKEFQYRILDAFANTEQLKIDYQGDYQQLQLLQKELNELEQQQAAFEKEMDYKNFLFDELAAANLDTLSPNEIEAALLQLENAGEIQQIGYSSYQAIDDSEKSITDQLASIQAELSRLATVHPGLEQVHNSIKSAVIELKELAADLRNISEDSEVNPEKVEELNEQLHQYRNLVQKHKVMDVSDLIKIREQLDSELLQMSSNTERIEELRNTESELRANCESKASRLSDKRFMAQSEIQSKWKADLNLLGMPNGEISFSLGESEQLNKWGKDVLQIMFASNKGGSFEPLHKVASGGELSRIMLIVKSYLARLSALPTMVLDEIDTGVSGETARKVADMMAHLAVEHQLITITHLPQIAAKAAKHFYVYKEDGSGVTHSHIKELNPDERIYEIAKMLSGENPTDTAKQNAIELIKE
jgi:DNA repair protein RecN (Recombination protein N)